MMETMGATMGATEAGEAEGAAGATREGAAEAERAEEAVRAGTAEAAEVGRVQTDGAEGLAEVGLAARTVLRARRLSAAYDGKTVLHDVSLDVARGRITAVVGPSGCGKSTLLHCLNGMLRGEPGATTGGEVLLVEADGTELDTATLPSEEVCRRVGLVFQTPSPFPFSVYKNMTYVLRYYGFVPGGLGSKAKAKADEAVRACLDRVGLLGEVGDDLRRNALKLSGGQQQRLCIARALAARPEVLLLDEPCSALDVKSTAVIESLLKGLAGEVPVVIVTHNIAQAHRIADDLVVMRDGGIVEAGRAADVFENPATEFAREFLGGAFG